MLEIISKGKKININLDGGGAEILTELSAAAHNVIDIVAQGDKQRHQEILEAFTLTLQDALAGKFQEKDPAADPVNRKPAFN